MRRRMESKVAKVARILIKSNKHMLNWHKKCKKEMRISLLISETE